MNAPQSLSRRQILRGRILDALGRRTAPTTPTPAASPARPAPAAPRAVPIADPTPPPGAAEADQRRMPELRQSVLDPATLAALFNDLEHCAKVLEVVPKQSRHRFVEAAAVSLDEGRRMLLAGEARAVQIRYLYDNAEWWDTLIAEPAGVRIVRIRHDHAA